LAAPFSGLAPRRIHSTLPSASRYCVIGSRGFCLRVAPPASPPIDHGGLGGPSHRGPQHGDPTYYDFPAEPWGYIRTTKPVESIFATVRLWTDKTRGCLSRDTMLAMVYKLFQSAAKRWQRWHAAHYLLQVISGTVFKDGLQREQDAA
jgi:hypothetical protein